MPVMLPNMSSSQASIRTAYDVACEAYARKFIHELDHKPLDRELLKRFSSLVGPERPVLDIGCGPGHTTAHLTSLGLMATGLDMSPKMIEKASELFPQTRFLAGDFFVLPNESSSIAGILAFYCFVHLTPEQLLPERSRRCFASCVAAACCCCPFMSDLRSSGWRTFPIQTRCSTLPS